jgi:hypothetical protein
VGAGNNTPCIPSSDREFWGRWDPVGSLPRAYIADIILLSVKNVKWYEKGGAKAPPGMIATHTLSLPGWTRECPRASMCEQVCPTICNESIPDA